MKNTKGTYAFCIIVLSITFLGPMFFSIAACVAADELLLHPWLRKRLDSGRISQTKYYILRLFYFLLSVALFFIPAALWMLSWND